MMTLQKVREGILRAWVDSYLDLRDQLAAEREKAKQWYGHYAALNRELIDLRDQLAAEQELVKYWRGAYAALHKELIEERRLHDERMGVAR